MKTTGYMLREAIKQHELRSQAATSRLPDSLMKFPNEEKEAPTTIVEQMLEDEVALAQLRTAQARYNLMVTLPGPRGQEPITLGEAVKQLVAFGKAEKIWRDLAIKKRDRYAFETNERKPDTLIATPTITNQECARLAKEMSKIVATLRQSIATANAREVEIENLDPSLFE